MELGKHNGEDRVVISSVAELAAVRIIVRAFAKFARDELELSEESSQETNDAVDALDDTLTLILNARTSIHAGAEAEDTIRFGDPYIGIIRLAVNTFEQRPDLLEANIAEDELFGAQTFFPPRQNPELE